MDQVRAAPGEFAACFTTLQQRFFQRYPRRVKELILLVKHWYQEVIYAIALFQEGLRLASNSGCLCLSSAGIKAMCYHTSLCYLLIEIIHSKQILIILTTYFHVI